MVISNPIPHDPQTHSGYTLQQEDNLSTDEFIELLQRSGLHRRRPVNNRERIEAMVHHANLMVTARSPEGTLLGIARSLTDFSFCCYLSDLAVDQACQKQGIGKALIEYTRHCIGPHTQLLLLAAPAARHYYGHIGFRYVRNAWSLDRE